LAAAASLALASDFRPARVLEAEGYTERQTQGAVIKGNGGIYSAKHDMNRVTVALDGMRISGVFESHWSWSVKAADLVVGTEVPAKVEKDKLVVLTPEGKTIRARITRRELEPATRSGPANNSERDDAPDVSGQAVIVKR
jgi:hypothetical protein